MNRPRIAIVVFSLLIIADCSNILGASESLAEERGECAEENKQCSKLSLGNGPQHCCDTKGCSCDPASRECYCFEDRIDVTFGRDWNVILDAVK